MKKCFLLCMLLFSLPCWAESALNLSQYKTIQDLYFNEQATTAIMQRMGKALRLHYDPSEHRPFRYGMTLAEDEGVIHRMKNGLYFGKKCFQGSCDMFLQEKGHQTIIIMDTLGRSFDIFFKDPLSQQEINKMNSEIQKIIINNAKDAKAKESKKFTLALHFFNQ